MNPLVAAARRLAFLIWRARVKASLIRADVCRLSDLDLVIDPGVLHPAHFESSRLLASYLGNLTLQGMRVADIGTGSGLLGLVAARAGAAVTASDISPLAVSCAAGNARRNNLTERMATLESDVWNAFPEHATYDLVVTNPPFYPRAAQTVPDHAFAAGDGHAFFVKLVGGLPARLRKGGSVLLIYSSDTDFTPIASMLEPLGLRSEGGSEKRGLFETLTVRRFWSRT